jgi:hypothetical protein
MDEQDLLAQRFEAHRPPLRSVAYRMLGSSGEAEKVTAYEVIADPARLARLDLAVLGT